MKHLILAFFAAITIVSAAWLVLLIVSLPGDTTQAQPYEKRKSETPKRTPRVVYL